MPDREERPNMPVWAKAILILLALLAVLALANDYCFRGL
jgi:hypothetical protein